MILWCRLGKMNHNQIGQRMPTGKQFVESKSDNLRLASEGCDKDRGRGNCMIRKVRNE